MQTLVKLAVSLVFIINVNAQTATPEPPKPPATYSGTHSSSLSISKSDNDYRIKARFHKSRFTILKEYLVNELGEDSLNINGNTYIWTHGSEAFECKLTTTSLKLSMDYDSNNETFIKHVERIGKNLKYKVSGGNPEEDLKRAEAEVARAQHELNEAKKRLEQKKH